MKKKTTITLLAGLVVLFLLGVGGTYITKLIIKDVQLAQAERVIEEAKEEWAKCEVIMKEAPKKADEARETIAEINGDFKTETEEAQKKSPSVQTLTGPNLINN